jgi:hypothetical protein
MAKSYSFMRLKNDAVVFGCLLVLSGLLLNKWSLERIFAPDEHISSGVSTALIVVFELCLLLAGLWLLLKRPVLTIPVLLRRTVVLGLAAGVLLGSYGSMKAMGVIDPHRDARNAWKTMVASEELIFDLTPQFKALAASLNNLKFPDHLSQDFFEAQVAVIDLTAADPAPKVQQIEKTGIESPGQVTVTHRTAADAAPKVQQIENTGIEVPDWKVATEGRTESAANLQLWRRFLDRVEYVNFPWTEFKAAKAKFLNEERDRFEINLLFQGVGRLKSGGWVWVKANNEVRWKKQPQASAKEPAKWKIYEWRTVRFSTMERSELLFGEVLDVVLSPDVAAQAKRSIHEELRLASILDKDKKSFKAPHKHFTIESLDRHPGIAVVDLDRDGFDDIYFLADYGKNMFFRNRGDGTFEEIASKLGLDLDGQSSSAIFADFDNDGHLDVFIGRTLSRSVYLRWENGRFVDRSASISKGPLPFLVSSVSAADYDGDGLLDVYFATYAAMTMGGDIMTKFEPDVLTDYLPQEDIVEMQRLISKTDNPWTNRPGPPNVLLRNLGGGSFEVVKDTPLRVFKNTFQATWGDFDGDGKPDLFLANDYSRPTLFRNLGAGKFAEVTEEMGLANARFGMGATWGDYDNDGRMDLYMAAMSSKAGRRILAQLPNADPRFAVLAAGNVLYRNLPTRLEKTSGPAAPMLTVEQSGWDWGAQFVDLNNDGWLDIFSLSGYYTAPKQVETDFDI